jgi:acetyl-CoA carboxylase carboxyltransferase component
LGGTEDAKNQATSELAARFDSIHSVERAQKVGSIDDIIQPAKLRAYIAEILARDANAMGNSVVETTPPRHL